MVIEFVKSDRDSPLIIPNEIDNKFRVAKLGSCQQFLEPRLKQRSHLDIVLLVAQDETTRR